MAFKLRHDHKTALLQGIDLFANCSPSQQVMIADLLVDSEVPKGKPLTREGQDAGTAYIIVKGTASVTRNGRQLATLGPQDIVGELSLFDSLPRTATVTALTDMQVLAMTHDDLATLLLKVPGLAYDLLLVLSRRLRELDTKAAAL